MTTPLTRSSTDICIQGLKGSGKSFYTTIMSYNLYNKGYNIFSNYKLNYPHTFISSIEDLINVSGTRENKAICILDDLERWISCRTWSSRKTQNIMEIILNLGKKNTSLWYTCKIFDNCDKWVRDCTDLIATCKLQMKQIPTEIQQYNNYNVLENLFLIVYYETIEGKSDSYDVLWDLHKYKHLYDTSELIKDIKKF